MAPQPASQLRARFGYQAGWPREARVPVPLPGSGDVDSSSLLGVVVLAERFLRLRPLRSENR